MNCESGDLHRSSSYLPRGNAAKEDEIVTVQKIRTAASAAVFVLPQFTAACIHSYYCERRRAFVPAWERNGSEERVTES